MKTEHNETSLSISTHEPASNSQPTIFAPNNEGGTECLRKSSTNEHSPQDCSWDNILTWSTLTFGKPRKRKKEQLFRCAKNRNTQIKNPSTLALPNPTRTWMTYSKNGDHLTCCCDGVFWCNGTGLHAIEKMPRSRTCLKTECEDAATTTHVTHQCVFSKIDWTWYFTKRAIFLTIVEGKKTWGTRHTILLRNVGRRNNVRLVPIKKNAFISEDKRNCKLPAHNVCTRKKESKHALVSQTNASIVVTQDKWEWLPHRVRLVICLIIEQRVVQTNTQNGQQISHAKWWALRFSRLLSETTSENTDETRHPSMKKSPPTRKQVSDGSVTHHTRLTNHDINNLDRTTHGLDNNEPNDYTRRITRRYLMNQKATTQHCCCWEHAPRHWLQNDECWRIADHMPSSAPCWNHIIRKLQQQWAISNRHTSTSDLIINWHPYTTRFTMLHKILHIFETTLRTLIKLDMELHTRSYSSTSKLDRSPTKHK